MLGCRSGQSEWSVKPSAQAYPGSNPGPSTSSFELNCYGVVMTEIQKTNPMGSPEQQSAAIAAFASVNGVPDWMVEIAPNGVPRLADSGPSSPHRDNYYFNRDSADQPIADVKIEPDR